MYRLKFDRKTVSVIIKKLREHVFNIGEKVCSILKFPNEKYNYKTTKSVNLMLISILINVHLSSPCFPWVIFSIARNIMLMKLQYVYYVFAL